MTILFWIICVMLALIVSLAYFNRGSDKVMSALFASTALILGAIVTAVVFTAPSTERKTASVVIFFQKDDLLLTEPLAGWRRDFGQALMLAQRDHVKALLNNGNSELPGLLSEFLQAAILHWVMFNVPVGEAMSRFQVAAGPVVMRMGIANLAIAKPTSSPSSWTVNVNKFGNENLFLTGPPMYLWLPENTKLNLVKQEIKPDGTIINPGKITFSNPLVTLNIYSQTIFQNNPSFILPKFLRMSDAEREQVRSAGFLLTTEISFTKWRAGDPSFSEAREWPTAVAQSLIDAFDEQKVWKDYLDTRD